MRGDRALDGQHVHADAVAARRDQVGLPFQRQEGHLVKAVGQFGVLLDLLQHHVGHLGNAGNKELDIPLLLMLGILPVVLHDAVVGGVGEQLDDAVLGLAGELGDLRGGLGLAEAHFQHDLGNLIVAAGAVQNDVFRILLRQLFEAEFIRQPVSDHFAEIKQDLSCHTVCDSFPVVDFSQSF